eukprot:360310-Pleurochrysis_carterae.AAC.2
MRTTRKSTSERSSSWRDEVLPDNCSGQDFADKCPTPASDLGDSSLSSYCRRRWQVKDAHYCAN